MSSEVGSVQKRGTKYEQVGISYGYDAKIPSSLNGVTCTPSTPCSWHST